MPTDLLVYMNNKKVGILKKHHFGELSFTYDHEWLQDPLARPISLSLPLQEKSYKGEIVYNYFDNLLPDNESLRIRIQKRFGVKSNQCFDLLSYIGKDCVGALQLLSEPLSDANQKISAKALINEQISKILNNYRDAPLGMQLDTDFRISIAGAQEKTAFLRYKDHWCLPTQSTPTTHIFKLPIGYIQHSGIDLSDSVENEWLCLKILSEFNLPVNKAEIAEFDGTKVLICERFDRKWNEDHSMIFRLPQEDICQVFGFSSALKYESDGGPGIKVIMDLLTNSQVPHQDRYYFFKACFLFWILGAIDGHAKNFSISIQPRGAYQLTPFYDVLSAYPLINKNQLRWNNMRMAMGVQGKNKHYQWRTILLRHWENMANLCKFPRHTFNMLVEEVYENMEKIINKVERNLPKSFSIEVADSIFKGMRDIKNKH